ncbi:MAG: lipid-A-disaccharide synthase [Bacteroidales bacterium]|nr:lipid-A-disaccharide synthase [Bacteroidales bacterium]
MRYYIIAGEASGDLHGSNLMKGLYAEDPNADIRFWGGDLMASVWHTFQNNPSHDFVAGRLIETVHRTVSCPLAYPCGQGGSTVLKTTPDLKSGLVRHYKEGAVMGFVEVLAKAGRLMKNVRFCKEDILSWNPDVVILIDYPGFNFKIAEFAHKAGFKVFYYIAPKVWASREGRIKKLKKYVDKLYIVFPFEKPYFDSKGVDYIYIGNPLVDAIDNSGAMSESRDDFLKRNSLEDRPIIAMLAGSRKNEISTMMPVLTEFAAKMHSLPEYSDYQFLIAGAPARTIEDYDDWLTEENSGYLKILFGETHSIIRQAKAGVINSGTASLETVLLGTPQVVGYITNPLTYQLARKIIKVKYISLGNLIADRPAFKEMIQDDCNAESLVTEVRALIEDKDYRDRMLADYADIRAELGGTGASAAVARSMIEELAEKDASN